MRCCIGKCIILISSLIALNLPAKANVEISGIVVEDSTKVANTELKLNGAGVRTKAFFNVYVAALYQSGQKSTAEEVISMAGPKRLSITMLREVSADTLSKALLDGLNKNCTSEEKTQLFNQMLAIGEIFGMHRYIKPNDQITLDWIPEKGTVIQLNGKKLREPIPDINFYIALLKIWIGEHPAEKSLKKQLLGQMT